MEKANDIIGNIINSVLTALYKSFGASVIFAFILMFLFLYAKQHEWNKENFVKNMLSIWCDNYKNDAAFKKFFFMAVYTIMILFRTIFNRDIWNNPLSDVMGDWGLHKSDGSLSSEPIENVMLFIPFTILLLWTFRKELLGGEVKFGKTLFKVTKVAGIFSFAIEFSQLLFHLGTFQISDLVYNTLGGAIGGMGYYIIYRIRHRKK